MSVFTVTLQNINQGTLDVGTDGAQNSTSIQRQIHVHGPGRVLRTLSDGETFTDCNYWKKFAYPQVPYDQAFIVVTDDDGSVYSDTASENTYPLVYDLTVLGGSTYADNVADIATDTGGYAVFTQITNAGTQAGQAVRVRLNGLTNAVFDLPHATTQIFNSGELSVSKIEIDSSTSGNDDVEIQILLSVRSVCNS